MNNSAAVTDIFWTQPWRFGLLIGLPLVVAWLLGRVGFSFAKWFLILLIAATVLVRWDDLKTWVIEGR